MYLTQQGEQEVLVQVGTLLGSAAHVHLVKVPDWYRFDLSSLESHRRLISYLTDFSLRAKALVYRRWWRVYLAREDREEGAHLTFDKVDERGLRKLARLCRMIRQAERTEVGGTGQEAGRQEAEAE